MKRINKTFFVIPAACLLLLAAGCTSAIRGEQILIDEETVDLDRGYTLKDVIQAFGAPDNVAPFGEDRLYYFVAAAGSGGGVGIGAIMYQVFHIGRSHTVHDTLIVRVDKAGRVVSFENLNSQDIRRGAMWPFGD